MVNRVGGQSSQDLGGAVGRGRSEAGGEEVQRVSLVAGDAGRGVVVREADWGEIVGAVETSSYVDQTDVVEASRQTA